MTTFTTRCHDLKVFRLNSTEGTLKNLWKNSLREKPDGSFVRESDQASRRDQLERESGRHPAGKTKETWKISVACQECHPVSSLRTG